MKKINKILITLSVVVSIYRKHGLYDDYEFEENITEMQIEKGDFVKLP